MINKVVYMTVYFGVGGDRFKQHLTIAYNYYAINIDRRVFPIEGWCNNVTYHISCSIHPTTYINVWNYTIALLMLCDLCIDLHNINIYYVYT